MALFKILRGSHENLPKKKTDGYCYFTTDTGLFYIDISANERLALNANDAQTLLGKTVITDITKDSVDIPTSGAVWEAIKNLSTSTNTVLDTKMNKNNPTGTGYFSLNRKAGSMIRSYSFAEGYNTTASGKASHAEGDYTTASGDASHAEGYQTRASGNRSHAEGFVTVASEFTAHAEGHGTEASGSRSHAEGDYTTASGEASHAEGDHTLASGNRSHAEGKSSLAEGEASHAEGKDTKSQGETAHAEGYQTTALGAKSHIEGTSTLAVSSTTSAKSNEEIINTWDSYKFALAKGDASHVEGKDNLALGTISHAEGYKNIALGNGSHVEGQGTIAKGSYMHVQGQFNKSTEGYAHVVGWGDSDSDRKDIHRLNTSGDAWYAGKLYSNDSVSAMATNITNGVDKDKNDVPGALRATNLPLSLSSVNLYNVEKQYVVNECCYIDTKDENGREGYSVYKCIKKIDTQGINLDNTEYWENLGEISSAEFLNKNIPAQGYSPKAEGIGSMAIGYNTKAFGDYSFASGNGSTARGNAAHAEGYQTKAEGNVSHAEGTYTKAYGDNSHAEGTNSETHGADSHAEGTQTIAMADSAHAEGKYTTANSVGSHAEGICTIAEGEGAHAMGQFTIAQGSASTAEGTYTFAYGDHSHAEGMSNGWISKIVLTGDSNATEYSYQAKDESIKDSFSYYNSFIGSNVLYNNELFEIVHIDETKITFNKTLSKDTPLEKISVPIYKYGAYGTSSHAQGLQTLAIGDFSHAEGTKTIAYNQCSHAEGTGSWDYPIKFKIIKNNEYPIQKEEDRDKYYIIAASNEQDIKVGYLIQFLNQYAYIEEKDGLIIKLDKILKDIDGQVVNNEIEIMLYTHGSTGYSAHAEGGKTLAGGMYSHAEGEGTKALGGKSHTEGYDTIAYGQCSHAEGEVTNANGIASHTEGRQTQALGGYSHAEGNTTMTFGESAHVENAFTLAYGIYSHAEGEGDIEPVNLWIIQDVQDSLKYRIVQDENNLTNISNDIINYEKAVIRYANEMVIIKDINNSEKTITVNKTLNLSTEKPTGILLYEYGAFGLGSHSEGKATKTVGDYSHAEGYGAIASGDVSHAEGHKTIASGMHSHAEGAITNAIGSSSHAEGSYNTAYARQSHVEGYKTVAGTEEAYEIDNSSDNGIGSGVIACHAEGDNTVASGSKSHAEGSYSRATGRVSHAEGCITEASGYYAHSENYKTRAIGESSHAEGYMSHASGNYSHSENDNTKANGIGSHAEGYATEANAEYSHAEGHSSKAYGRYSYAGGLATISTGAHSHVRGTRNIADTELQSRYLGSLKCSLNNLKTFPLSANETYNTNDVVLYNNIYWRYKLGNDTTTNIIPGEDSSVWADISDYRGKYLEIVGNGVDGSPSNAYTLDWDGNAWFAGDVAVGADSDVLATQNFVNWQISAIPSKQGTVHTALVSNDVKNNKAAGSYSYANGYNTEVNGDYSYASGTNNQAVGSCQTVIGAYNEIDTIIQTRSSSTGDFIGATYDVSTATTYDPNVTYSFRSIVYYHNTYYMCNKIGGSIGILPTNKAYWISLAERAGKYLFIVGNGKEVKGNITRSNAMTVDWSGNAWFAGTITGTQVYGAVWNDYAEYRDQIETIEPGYCVVSADNGQVSKTTEKFQVCDGIVSDTFGFAIGETDNCKTPLAVAGRVLAYCEGDRLDYHAGDTVCAGPNGKVVKMTREEIREWPDRIVGTVSEIPMYETWGTGNVAVNGRIWIKIK